MPTYNMSPLEEAKARLDLLMYTVSALQMQPIEG